MRFWTGLCWFFPGKRESWCKLYYSYFLGSIHDLEWAKQIYNYLLLGMEWRWLDEEGNCTSRKGRFTRAGVYNLRGLCFYREPLITVNLNVVFRKVCVDYRQRKICSKRATWQGSPRPQRREALPQIVAGTRGTPLTCPPLMKRAAAFSTYLSCLLNTNVITPLLFHAFRVATVKHTFLPFKQF